MIVGIGSGKAQELIMLLEMRVKDKFGYVDLKGKEVVPPLYTEVGRFSDEHGWLLTEKHEGMIVDSGGNVTAKLGIVEELGVSFSGGYLAFKRDGKHGFVDEQGHMIIQPRFDDVGHVREGRVIASQHGKYGIFSMIDEWLLEPTYAVIHEFPIGGNVTIACRGLDQDYVLIDSHGKLQSQKKFAIARGCNEGLVPVAFDDSDTSFGWVDYSGNTVMRGRFENLGGEFNNGTIPFAENAAWGLVDKSGRVVLEASYWSIRKESESKRVFCKQLIVEGWKEYLWGFLNSQGKVAIEAQYDSADDFRYGAALVSHKVDRLRHYQWIDDEGNTIIKWRR